MPYHFPNETDKGFVNPGIAGAQSAQILSGSRQSSSILFDSFGRKNTLPGNIGTSDSGWPWMLYGYIWVNRPFTSIVDGAWVSSNTTGFGDTGVYVSPIRVSEVGATISFLHVAGVSQGNLKFSLIITNRTDSMSANNQLVFTVDYGGVTLYSAVNHGGNVTLLHTAFPARLHMDGTRYNVSMSLKGNNAILTAGPYQYSVDSDMIGANSIGPYVCFQHYNPQAHDINLLRAHNVWTSDFAR